VASYNFGYTVRLRLWTCLALAGLSGSAIFGSDYSGLSVIEIKFEPETQPFPASTLDKILQVSVGDQLAPAALRTSIEHLFDTGRYADVQVDARPEHDGVALTFLTKPSWFIGDVRVEGVPQPPSESQLVNATNFELGELYTPENLGLAEQAIRQLLGESGFRQATVKSEVAEDPSTQQVNITFSVDPGLRARIGGLLVAGPAPPLNEHEIRLIAGWKRGSPYRYDRLQTGISKLKQHFQKQNYWQVDVAVQTPEFNTAENALTMVVRIDLGPKIVVRIEGDKLSESKLRRYLPVFEEGVIDDDLLAEGRTNLINFFQTKGYFNAAVDYEVERSTDDEAVIVYTIQRGQQQSLERVEVSGNYFFDLETIRERMGIEESGFQMRRGRFNQSLLANDLSAIRNLYISNGFHEVEVSGRIAARTEGEIGHLTVFIDIDEGLPTIIDGLTTSGLDNFPAIELLFEFASAPHQAYSATNIATDRDLILAEYYNAGFQNAVFDWRVEPTDDPHRVIIFYDVAEGESIRLRKPIIAGVRRTRPEVVERRIELVPDSPLSQTEMFDTQRNLYDLGVFSKVNVALQNPNGIEDAKNIILQVEEARRWALGFGGGAEFARIGSNNAELTNPVGEATFSPRVTVEVTRLNVLGKAHTMGFRTRLSALQQRGLFTYEAPRWFDSDRWGLTISGLLDTSRNVNTFTGRRLEGALQFTQQLNRATTVLYRYAYRRTAIDENTLNIEPLLVPLISQPVRVGLFSATYIQDRRDDPTDSTEGVYNTLDVSLASGLWGSQPDFFRALLQNSTYHRLSRRVVFARTVQLGLNIPWSDTGLDGVDGGTFGVRPDPRIPISERYFAGGANSHRGFPFNQSGPRDPATGFPIGGGSQFLNSVELRFPLFGVNIGGVLFHDAGNVYSRPGRISFRGNQGVRIVEDGVKEFDFDYMVHAVGFGVRYRTPIGPVRLDLAYSVNPPRFVGFDGTRAELLAGTGTFREQRINSLQFHFSLGQTF
jgi:outer membrane protein insertion porin family